MGCGIECQTAGQLEALRRDVNAARDAVREYLGSRQSPSGGFCFYRSQYTDHPNIADTACAVRSFAILGEPVPHASRVRAFLSALGTSSQPEYLFHLATALQALQGEPLSAEIAALIGRLRFLALPAREFQQTGWLERTRFLVHLRKMVHRGGDEVSAIAGYVREQAVNGGFGTTPNLWDTSLALDIMQIAGVAIPGETARFVDPLQCRPSGFTLCPDTQMSTLDTVFAGTWCCAMLGLPVRYPVAALQFVLACQSGSGGFAASPGALPDLELTERALRAMGLLCLGLREE
ncbi:prenyltransferase/squalene oxidase repeat-containing protein [Paraburkholderia tropica]|uniref:prenyltransferase/squalene oxidase repeat-containing protein n=1 Tax=Paraburkholderia tropica TaxID=92647 RepID=UPI002AB77D83|nr:prenyltransferase/squalene oxidase repeat-containing protein [Paraburkholderia tropica]